MYFWDGFCPSALSLWLFCVIICNCIAVILRVLVDISNSRPEEHYIRSMGDEAQKEWVRAIVDRMCEAYGLEGKGLKEQLADKLGLTSAGTVKSWIYNRRIPFHAMVTCKQDVDCSFDWLLTGKAPNVDFNVEVRELLTEKLVEHLFNAGRYKLVETADGIEVTASNILQEFEEVLSLQFKEEDKKFG